MPRPRTGRGRWEPRFPRLPHCTARPQPPHHQDTAHYHSHTTPITAGGQLTSHPAHKTRRPLPPAHKPGQEGEPRNRTATRGHMAAYRTDTTFPHRVKGPRAIRHDSHDNTRGEANDGDPSHMERNAAPPAQGRNDSTHPGTATATERPCNERHPTRMVPGAVPVQKPITRDQQVLRAWPAAAAGPRDAHCPYPGRPILDDGSSPGSDAASGATITVAPDDGPRGSRSQRRTDRDDGITDDAPRGTNPRPPSDRRPRREISHLIRTPRRTDTNLRKHPQRATLSGIHCEGHPRTRGQPTRRRPLIRLRRAAGPRIPGDRPRPGTRRTYSGTCRAKTVNGELRRTYGHTFPPTHRLQLVRQVLRLCSFRPHLAAHETLGAEYDQEGQIGRTASTTPPPTDHADDPSTGHNHDAGGADRRDRAERHTTSHSPSAPAPGRERGDPVWSHPLTDTATASSSASTPTMPSSTTFGRPRNTGGRI